MSPFFRFYAFLIPLYISPSIGQIFDCVGTHQCFNRTITCSEDTGVDCMVHCSGAAACSFSTILCPQSLSAKCSVTCSDSFSCSHMVISAPNALSLDINSDGDNALAFSQIFCPSNPLNNSCVIAYSDTQYGFNNIDIYSLHAYNTIDLQCTSITDCWSNDHNPTLHFGDAQYSKICTIYDEYTCESITLTAEYNIAFIATDDCNNNNNNNKSIRTDKEHNNNPYILGNSVYSVVILVSIGVVCGIIISACCCVCFIVYNAQKNKASGLSIGRIRSVSPSLKHLSPRLQPQPMHYVIELPNDHELPAVVSQKHEAMNSMQVEVDTTMNLAEYTDYVDFVNEGLPNSYKETPTGAGSVSFVVPGSSDEEVTNGGTTAR